MSMDKNQFAYYQFYTIYRVVKFLKVRKRLEPDIVEGCDLNNA